MSDQTPEQEPQGPEQHDPTPIEDQPGEHEQEQPSEQGEPKADFIRNPTPERYEKGYIGTLPDGDNRPDLTLKGVVGGTNTEPSEG